MELSVICAKRMDKCAKRTDLVEATGTIVKLEPSFIVDFDVDIFLNANCESKNLKGLIEELKNQITFLFEQNNKLISTMSVNEKFPVTNEGLN